MRKSTFLVLFLGLLVFLAPSIVFAKDVVPFSIVASQADDFQPDKKPSITFSEEITIMAETVKGAKVIITVTPDKKLELASVVYDEIIVGATCKLIQPVKLALGDNLVEITVSKEGFEGKKETYTIRRKDGLILQSLQNMLVIPGNNR